MRDLIGRARRRRLIPVVQPLAPRGEGWDANIARSRIACSSSWGGGACGVPACFADRERASEARSARADCLENAGHFVGAGPHQPTSAAVDRDSGAFGGLCVVAAGRTWDRTRRRDRTTPQDQTPSAIFHRRRDVRPPATVRSADRARGDCGKNRPTRSQWSPRRERKRRGAPASR